jgi:hypothetical protein
MTRINLIGFWDVKGIASGADADRQGEVFMTLGIHVSENDGPEDECCEATNVADECP